MGPCFPPHNADGGGVLPLRGRMKEVEVGGRREGTENGWDGEGLKGGGPGRGESGRVVLERREKRGG